MSGGIDPAENAGSVLSAEAMADIAKSLPSGNWDVVYFSGNADSCGIVVSVGELLGGVCDAGDFVVSVHRSRAVPSEDDLSVSSECVESGRGFIVTDEKFSDVNVVVSPRARKSAEKIDENEAAFFLSDGGPLSKMYDSYEERAGQIQLVMKIASAFNEDSIGVFEAGTGVGKSFAYLVPAMLWAHRNGERVVISTGTINLQQQLIEKDIPLAEKIVGCSVKAVLVKGRQNYICLRRLSDVADDRGLFSDDEEAFEGIMRWSKVTKSGSRSDLPFQPPEGLWQRVNSESDACMGMRCRFYSKCFVMKMKRDASDAGILVVNHHLLFADIASRRDGTGFDVPAVLPPYKRLVLDEAHGIEGAATSFFSESLSRFKLIKQLNILFKRRKAGATGLLYSLCALSESEDASAEIEAEIEAAKNAVFALEEGADAFLSGEGAVRVRGDNEPRFAPVVSLVGALRVSLVNIIASLRNVVDGIPDDDRNESAVWEAQTVVRRLEAIVSVCGNFSEWRSHPESVFWIQRLRLPPSFAGGDGKDIYFQFMQTPLDIAPLMENGVFSPLGTVVCTSATLGIEGRFDYWEKRCGVGLIDPSRVSRGVFPSPFPYERNMVFAVPSDAPFPDRTEEFQSFVDSAVASLIKCALGRTLVLFTSYDMLRRTYNAVHEEIADAGITILRQGDDDRFRLMTRFRTETSSVLFATDSFWEGVDVPGDSLSQVVIVKLPFGVPSDPVFSARAELIQNAGGNSFMELSVPDAVIKFRQGFGRLVRRCDDKGAVVVLDRRIIEKRYGSLFLSSIPRTKRVYEPLHSLVGSIKPYLF